jgi:hypothetical protein
VDLRLVEYLAYLTLSVPLTLWVGRALQRNGAPFLTEMLKDGAVADSVSRLLVIGFYLAGLGGVALLLQVNVVVGSPADVVRAVATRVGLVLLLLGALHMINVLILHRLHRPAERAAPRTTEFERLEPHAQRWP